MTSDIEVMAIIITVITIIIITYLQVPHIMVMMWSVPRGAMAIMTSFMRPAQSSPGKTPRAGLQGSIMRIKRFSEEPGKAPQMPSQSWWPPCGCHAGADLGR